MTTRMDGRAIGALAMTLILVAACGSTAASPAGSGSPGDSVAAASSTASPSASASDSAGPTDSASASAPAATPAPRRAWTRGQIVKQYALVKPGKGWVYTNRGVWQTIDDGATWANATPPHLIVSKIRGLGALDPDHALLAVVDVAPGTSTYYVWRTTDAGLTWAYTALPGIPNEVPTTPCAPGDFCGGPGDPSAGFDYVDANTAFVTIYMRTGTDGMITYFFETNDGGVTWSRVTYDPPFDAGHSGQTSAEKFLTANIGVAMSDSQFSSTITGWGHWTNQHLSLADDYFPTMYFLSETKWYADLGLIYGTVDFQYTISTDQGHHWTVYHSSVPGVTDLTDAHVQFLGPLEWIGTELRAGGFSTEASQTIYTTDGGHHWAMEGAQPLTGTQAFFIDASHGWVGPNNYTGTGTPGLYTTRDGGRSWHLLTP